MNEYLTMGKMFYSFLLKQKEVAAPVTSKFFLYHIPRRGLY